ncbi:MAG TPA: ABC transporter ATP-binding protein [Candidatus Saccharimonadales bacterium]
MGTVIKTTNLTKIYDKNEVLSKLNLTLDEGQVLGYLGPNGAGKTTTIKLLLGLIRPSSGNASIFGHDCQTEKLTVHASLAYVPSEPAFWPNLTGRETLYMLSKLRSGYDEEYEKKLIKQLNFDPDKKIRQYSRGNRQKIGLISAFATKAKLLILDEPSTGLDPLMDQVFRQNIVQAKNNGQTIFLSSHLLEEVESLCDQIAILKDGKLVESGSLSQLKHLAAVTVEATFEGKVPDVKKIDGVTNVKIDGHKLTCQINGSGNELIAALVKEKPKQLYVRPASLEDLFLSVYGT